MMNRKPLRLLLASLAVATLLLVAAGTIAALPGASASAPASNLSAEQRDLIRSLHDSYRAAVAGLDWQLVDQQHDPETLQRAQELRSALRRAIFEVIHRDSEMEPAAQPARCPYSGKTVPAQGIGQGPTLVL